ncbi:MAG: cytochrome c nitrite reductase small subunit [Bacteroidales bacterium]|nr:cytochrome c nitrite reductase small subunit [Bacteroidales bacterium]
MKRFIQLTAPPGKWRIAAIILTGALLGLVINSFYFSKAWSYLSDDPKTCMNCHVMAPQFATWSHSAHREVATCIDCHVPHDNFFHKYWFKANDGLRHASIFTMRTEPQVIQIREAGAEVVQQNCIRCHEQLVTDYELLARTDEIQHARLDRSCIECHRETPHGRVNSLSSVPNALLPIEMSPVPAWIEKLTKPQP